MHQLNSGLKSIPANAPLLATTEGKIVSLKNLYLENKMQCKHEKHSKDRDWNDRNMVNEQQRMHHDEET